MATTTNYGWTTPDDTALVKDGASAIRTLGSSADTTTKNLNPSTTLGDIEFRSSTSNVNTRLGIGGTGTVLTVASGVPSWATPSSGSLTLLSTTTLSGASTTISSINQTYTHLQIYVFAVTNATANGGFNFQPKNGATSLTTQGVAPTGGSYTLSSTPTQLANNDSNDDKLLRTSNDNTWRIEISNYSSTTIQKTLAVWGEYATPNAGAYGKFGFGAVRSTSAVDALTFTTTGGDASTGTVLIYGVK